MILIKIALFLLVITLTFYLSEKIMWVVYFLFNFRIWHLIFEKTQFEYYENFGRASQLFILIILSLITYLIVYSIIMNVNFAPLKYIYLGVLMIIVFSTYSLGEIFFFQDIFNFNEMKNVENIEEVKNSTGLTKEIVLGWAESLGEFLKGYVKMIIEWVQKVMPI